MFLNLFAVFALLMGCLHRFSLRAAGCCADCALFADTFDRADSTDLGSDWSEEAGNWEIDANALTVGSNGAIAVHASALGASHYRVQVTLQSDTAGDVLAAVAFYADSNNHYSAEVTLHDTSPAIALYKTVSGTRTQLRGRSLLPGEANVDTPVTLTFCLEQAGAAGTLLSAELSTTQAQTRITAGDAALAGPGQAGVFVQNAAGTIAFEDFAIESTEDAVPGCPDCAKECSSCRHGMPDQFQVIVSGMVDEPLTCSGDVCPDLNATYTLDFDGINVNGWCQWSLDFPAISCPTGDYDRISIELLGTDGLRVALGNSGQPMLSAWQDAQSNVSELFDDDFDRADSSNLGPDWTEVSGDWEIASNRLTVGDDDALAVHSADFTADDYEVSAVVRSNTSGDQLGLVAFYADEDNFYEALVTIDNSSPVVSLYKTVAGTRTLLASRNLSGGSASTNIDVPVVLSIQAASGGVVLVADLGTAASRIAAFDDDLAGPGTAGFVARTAAGAIACDDFAVAAFDCGLLVDRTPGATLFGPCNFSGGAEVSVSAL